MSLTRADFQKSYAQIDQCFLKEEFDQALDLAEKLLLEFPSEPDAHYALARCCGQTRDFNRALNHVQKAISARPNNVDYNFFMGKLCVDAKLLHLALPLFQKSAKLATEISIIHQTLGDCYDELDMGAQAVASYRNALKLEKADTPIKAQLRLRLAQSLISSNNVTEAKPLLKRLIETNEINKCFALARYLPIADKSDLNAKLALAQTLANDVATPNKEKLALFLAIGRVHDQQKNYDEAFINWHKGRTYADIMNFTANEYADYYTKLTSFFKSDVFETTQEFAAPSQVPVFIVGMPRSGTTLCDQILSSHSQIGSAAEVGNLRLLEEGYLEEFANQPLEALAGHGQKGFLREIADAILKTLETFTPERKKRIVEKTPHNFERLGFLNVVFPHFRAIHIRRNPMDTFISTYQQEFSNGHRYVNTQEDYATEYLWHEKIMDHWKSLFPEKILTINYEDLVARPEEVAKKMLAFIGMEWEPGVLDFYKAENRTVRTFSTQQVRNPVNTASVEKWRRYEKHLGPLMKALEDANFTYKINPV